MSDEKMCPCGTGREYGRCCGQYHEYAAVAETAEQLMRSRYTAYTLGLVDYIVDTTVPSQQLLLDREGILSWSRAAEWLGLEVLQHKNTGKNHALVEFKAHYFYKGERAEHDELSGFVRIEGRWYFIDPTVPLPSMKQDCVCGSGKKFKACCGYFFR